MSSRRIIIAVREVGPFGLVWFDPYPSLAPIHRRRTLSRRHTVTPSYDRVVVTPVRVRRIRIAAECRALTTFLRQHVFGLQSLVRRRRRCFRIGVSGCTPSGFNDSRLRNFAASNRNRPRRVLKTRRIPHLALFTRPYLNHKILHNIISSSLKFGTDRVA